LRRSFFISGLFSGSSAASTGNTSDPISADHIGNKEFFMTRTFRILMLVSAMLFSLTPIYAQKQTGDIKGTISDAKGAVVAGATVTATNQATGTQRTVTTNAQGDYSIGELTPGLYEVKATGQGFKDTVVKNVDLHVASASTVNLKLEVGAASETITVEANAIQVETTTAAVGEVVNGQQVRELPLNGRSFVQLTQLQPGVSAANNFDSKNKGLQSGVDFSVNGNPTTNNLFLVDGANNNDIGSNRTILVYPSIDAIAEFKMLRNSYGPEYGQASGSVISIVTRGGTNQFHGGVSYFGRNDALNATDYFAARQAHADELAGVTGKKYKDKLRRNDYGYNIGGPIVKDHLFFFWSQEWNKEIRGITRSACVPTAAERSGDFSHGVSCYEAGKGIPSAALVPGGIIANPDPTGLAIAQLFPLPNTVASASNNNKNWVQSIPSKIDWREENARMDWNITKKHSMTFRYTQDSWTNPAPNAQNYWGDDPFPALEGNWDQPSKSIVGKVTSVLTNTLVNDVQFSYSNNRIAVTLGGTDPSLVDKVNQNFPTIFPASQKVKGGLPTIWSGLGPYGDFNNLWLISPFNNAQDLYTVRDDISKTSGNHQFKVGAYLSWNSKDEGNFGGQDRPNFGAEDWAVKQPTGNDLANILLPGQVFAGMAEPNVNIVDHARWRDYEFYFGDSWKAKSNFTLEYGFRWSFLREPFAADNVMSSWNAAFYNPALPASDVCNGIVVVPGTDPCGASGIPGLSKGTPGPNRALRENNNHLIAPRFGASWDPWGNGKTAIRAGVGQFFQRERISQQVGAANNAPFAISASADRSFAVAPAVSAAAGKPTTGFDPRGVVPNSWQWNLSVEQELARETTFQIGYVGNRGLHLTNTYDQNPVLVQNRLLAAFQQTPDALRLAPNFGSINRFGRDASSSYHALQTMFRTKIKNHVNLQAVYTWSHSIADADLDNSSGSGNQANFTDYTNHRLDKGNSTINRPHIFVFNTIIYGPSLKDSNPFMQGVFGGWEFTTITTAESGNSLTVFNQGISDGCIVPGSVPPAPCPGNALSNLSGTGFTQNLRPNITGIDCNASVPGAQRDQIFNPAAFTFVGYQIGTIGNTPRGYCHGPSNINSDLAFYKNWKVKERVGIQFRAEFFNAFNHANFRGDLVNNQFTGQQALCGPTAAATPCSPTNSVITGTTGSVAKTFGQASRTRGPREIQYAIKFTF
jgi:hypothetical protein